MVAGAVAAVLLLLAAAFGRLSDIDRQSGGVIAVGEDQLSVFADVPTPSGAEPFEVGPSGTGACSLTPVGGGDPVLTEASGIQLTFKEGNSHWVRVGIVPSGTPAGAYELACARHRTDMLAVAVTEGIKRGVLLIVAGVAVAIGSLVLAFIAFVVIIVRRSRAKNRLRRHRALAGGYQPPYGSPPPGL